MCLLAVVASCQIRKRRWRKRSLSRVDILPLYLRNTLKYIKKKKKTGIIQYKPRSHLPRRSNGVLLPIGHSIRIHFLGHIACIAIASPSAVMNLNTSQVKDNVQMRQHAKLYKTPNSVRIEQKQSEKKATICSYHHHLRVVSIGDCMMPSPLYRRKRAPPLHPGRQIFHAYFSIRFFVSD